MTPRIVFLGRQVHLQTKSDAFFIELLREVGDVAVIRRDAHSNRECLKRIHEHRPDTVVFYQLPPSLWHHLVRLPRVKKVWVPMWDGFRQLNWKRRLSYRLSGVETVAFCDKLLCYFESIGLTVQPVRYFPQPQFAGMPCRSKPPYTVFLWQRDVGIGLETILRLFPAHAVGKVIFKSDLEAAIPSGLPFEVERLQGWVSKEILLAKVQEADYYLAPRRQEGIGFSFLEAMAMGKPVIGYNDATMNEYIQEGITGHLFDERGPLSIHWPTPAEMHAQHQSYCERAYANWLADRAALKAKFGVRQHP